MWGKSGTSYWNCHTTFHGWFSYWSTLSSSPHIQPLLVEWNHLAPSSEWYLLCCCNISSAMLLWPQYTVGLLWKNIWGISWAQKCSCSFRQLSPSSLWLWRSECWLVSWAVDQTSENADYCYLGKRHSGTLVIIYPLLCNVSLNIRVKQ